MNTEIFIAVLAALIAYRVLSPLIDAINPMAFFNKPKMISAVAITGKSAPGIGISK